jgi:hypothetical protein
MTPVENSKYLRLWRHVINWVILFLFCFIYFIPENLHSWSNVSLISLLLLNHALTRKRRRTRTWSRTSLIQYSSLFVIKMVTELPVSNMLTHFNGTSCKIFPFLIYSTPFLLVLIKLKICVYFHTYCLLRLSCLLASVYKHYASPNVLQHLWDACGSVGIIGEPRAKSLGGQV